MHWELHNYFDCNHNNKHIISLVQTMQPKTWRSQSTMVFKTYTPCLEKNIPNIISCHLKRGYPILIIFSTFILGTTDHQMTIQCFTSTNVCFCTTWGKQNQRNISWNEQNLYVKKHPQHYRLWLKEAVTDFNNFWCKHFFTLLAIKWLF